MIGDKERGIVTHLSLVVILLFGSTSFVLGGYAHKRGWHRPIVDPVLRAIYNRVGFACNREAVNGYCPGSSKWKFQPYENHLINQLDSHKPEFSRKQTDNYEELLKAALGFDIFQQVREANPEKIAMKETERYEDGVLGTFFVDYSFPRISLRYYHATRSAEELIVVLHGHNSSALKVMGIDYEDYMRQAGKELFKSGYDVIAFDLTTNSEKSAYINSQLTLYGGQIYGLWSRGVCDTITNQRIHNRYRAIFLYGLSNGGTIADYVSILCGEIFSKIIVDDALEDWRMTAWRHPSIWGPQNYAVYYLAPLLSHSYLPDLVTSARSQKYYIGKSGVLKDMVENKQYALNVQNGIKHDNKINFVEKKLTHHVAELEVLDSILHEKKDLTGYHVVSSLDGLTSPQKTTAGQN